MKTAAMIEKIFRVKQCLMAHPDNKEGSEFEDRISDLQKVEDDLVNKLSKLTK